MARSFKEKLWNDYPIPPDISIWGRKGNEEADIDTMIESCVDELQDDVVVTDSLTARSLSTSMPKGTISVISARLAEPFQGNSWVKRTYDSSRNTLFLRFFPAIVKYTRSLKVEDLETLKGDQLRYVKAYTLWKMAQKELTILSSVNLSTDVDVINLETLQQFASQQQEIVNTLKPEILIYNNQ